MMNNVKSTFSIASQQADRMSQASNKLGSIQHSDSEASQTTITGNTNAGQTIKKAQQSIQSLVASFNGDISNITSVASEFARIDQEQSNTFNPIEELRLP